ncbi:MAG: cytochrome C biogenesis protein [Candidatus Marinimicrobia bacterium]|nr:cytochrome C biogenesis protein [Candidatus Neomarinimicrobiota bacterium]|tara:strand:+ start:225 stop:2201 length:1977 start_codon:yes stop_codon:yes gene_type:complete
MIPVLGSITLSIALGLCLIAFSLSLIGIRKKEANFSISAFRAVNLISILNIFSTFLLLNELIGSNFDIKYVAHYTSIETPFIYKITALWAGQSGSLLFWLCVLSVYTLIVTYQEKRLVTAYFQCVLLVLVLVQSFFLILLNFIENPFEPINVDFIVNNGNGLNPLLQNLTMAIHPPTLYLGYIGFTIPFAFAIGGLITKKLDSIIWIKKIRRWTLIAWLFQSAGIILGGWWAYQELGWGGYWAWDPVENASFMPWLTATAFLHSIYIQEKKGLLKFWNIILILTTFILVIFGTFLTRSGVMSSVHSFAVSDLGPAFLIFIFILLIVCSYLVWLRLPIFKSQKKIKSISSRESGILLNNVIFVVICFSVFWGTIFPVLSEAVRGSKITVGPPFYNQVNIPIGLILLFFTGAGPLLVWGHTSKKAFFNNFKIPIIVMVFLFVISFLKGIGGAAMVSFSLAGFSLAAILKEFWRGVISRKNQHNESLVKAFLTLINKNRNRYGGHFVHLGVIIMFVGFTGHAFDSEIEFSLKNRESIDFNGYRFELASLSSEERPNHFAYIAEMKVSNIENKLITTLYPEKRVYFHRHPNPDKRQPHSELDIYSTVRKDIYSIFSGIEQENQTAFFKIMINPLVRLVWYGGYILIIGTLIILLPDKEKSWI